MYFLIDINFACKLRFESKLTDSIIMTNVIFEKWKFRELKYKAERKAATMGILYYDDFENAEEMQKRVETEAEESNRKVYQKKIKKVIWFIP